MKKMITLIALILTVAATLPAQDQAPAACGKCQSPCDYSLPCPTSCDPCAPVCGTCCGGDLVYLGVGAAVVAGAAALIITSSHGTAQGHAHVHS